MSINGLAEAIARVFGRLTAGSTRSVAVLRTVGSKSSRSSTRPVHQLDGVELLKNAHPTDWVKERLLGWTKEGIPLGSFIPTGFEAYARIFHPAERRTADGNWEPLRWFTVASWNGKVVHPQMEFYRIANLDPYLRGHPPWWSPPSYGSLSQEECEALVSVLKGFTSTPERCCFCLWEGWGFLGDRLFKRAAKLKSPGDRRHLVFSGPLEGIRSFYERTFSQSPNIWWPEDRAWCVATEIDSVDTYVGGSKACIEQIIAHPDLEALPIAAEALANLYIRGDDPINV